MKKLMIALAAVAMAAGVQAATVDWQYKITDEASKTKNLYDGYTCYLVDSVKWAALEAVTEDTFSDTSIVYGSTTFNEGSGKSSYTYQTLSATGTKASYATALDDSVVAEGGALAVKYILVDGNGEKLKYFDGGDATLTGRGSTGESIDTGFLEKTSAAVQAGPWKTVGGDTPVIPEPTSGLLLLIGVAGLALRRKQK